MAATNREIELAFEYQKPIDELPNSLPISLPKISEGDMMLSVIARASRDPATDIGKMQQLLEMRERLSLKEAQQAFNEAMAAAQKEMKPVARNKKNPQTKSTYADYEALDESIRPIYTQHGFGLSFDTGEVEVPDQVRVLCYVSHSGGFSRTYKIDMPADGKGAKGGDVMTRTHATGAACSYGRRYLLMLIFNIASGDADDDGNGGESGPITEDQMDHIKAQIDRTGSDIEKLCRWAKVECLKDIRANQFSRLMEMLNSKPTVQK